MYQNKNFFLPTYHNFFLEVIRNTLIIFFGLTKCIFQEVVVVVVVVV